MIRLFFAKIQNLFLCLFVFSFFFEQWDPFNFQIPFLISKISFVIYLVSLLPQFLLFLKIERRIMLVGLVILYFIILCIQNFRNLNSFDTTIFYIPFLINVISLLTIVNHLSLRPHLFIDTIKWIIVGASIISIFYLAGIEVYDNLEGRISIFGENQNIIGLNLAIALIMSIPFFIGDFKCSKYFKYFLYVSAPLIFILLYKTGSRLAFISLVLAIFIFSFFNSKSNISKLNMVLIVLFLFFLSAIFVNSNKSSSELSLIERLFDSFTSGDLSGRDLIWSAVIPFFLDNIFLGIGMSGYSSISNALLGDVASPHNGIIEALIYTGLCGTFFFVYYLILLVKKAVYQKHVHNSLLPLMLLVPILGILFSGQIFESKMSWFVMSYIISLKR